MVRRGLALLSALIVLVVASIAWAVAAPASASAAPPAKAPDGLCSVEEWQKTPSDCLSRLTKVSETRAQCLTAPTPTPPDAGLAGFFAEVPEGQPQGTRGLYSRYGYAGYSYTTYDLDAGCASGVVEADSKIENTIANGEFMIATAVIGASNALRERAWDPGRLWDWADPLVGQATKAVYQKVFTVFGVVSLAIVGLYLIWRSRQAEMGSATTTAGWAVLIMVIVTAIAAWPENSSKIADQTLITGLSAVHEAVGPQPEDLSPDECVLGTPEACKDNRPPAVRASDTATESMLYRNWLRGLLGSADSETAQKYGRQLYNARAISWEEAARMRENVDTRDGTLERKQAQWKLIAEQIKQEDPAAYDFLRGTNGMDRIGAGFIALLAATFYAMFDLVASIMVLLGFLIFRWAVIVAPLLGTIGLLQPASAGIRRLGNAVVAAAFNVVIFGTGGAIYLSAVDLIMSASMAGWLQVTLVALCGVAGWLLLRPYSRITQLGGKDGAAAIATGGAWHRRFFRDVREASKLDAAEDSSSGRDSVFKQGNRSFDQRNLRPEARLEDPAHAVTARKDSTDLVPASAAPTRPDGKESSVSDVPASTPPADPAKRAVPARRPSDSDWSEPDVAEKPASFAIYRPETRSTTEESTAPRTRSEAR